MARVLYVSPIRYAGSGVGHAHQVGSLKLDWRRLGSVTCSIDPGGSAISQLRYLLNSFAIASMYLHRIMYARITSVRWGGH